MRLIDADKLREDERETDCKTCPHADKNGLCGHWEHKPCELDEIGYEWLLNQEY